MKSLVKAAALGLLFVSPAMYSPPAQAMTACQQASAYASYTRARASVTCSIAGDGSVSCADAGNAAFAAEMYAESVCSGGFYHRLK
jgi:hypothetical protein